MTTVKWCHVSQEAIGISQNLTKRQRYAIHAGLAMPCWFEVISKQEDIPGPTVEAQLQSPVFEPVRCAIKPFKMSSSCQRLKTKRGSLGINGHHLSETMPC